MVQDKVPIGTEVSTLPKEIVVSSTNPGGSWEHQDGANRAQGHAAYGPCEDPIKQEARDAAFADIVTLPILPEPQQTPALQLIQTTMAPGWGIYALKDRILGKFSISIVC